MKIHSSGFAASVGTLGISLVWLALAPGVAAQAEAGAVVPEELVRGLVTGMAPPHDDIREIMTATIPGEVREALDLPPGAREVGAVVRARSSISIVAVSSPAADALEGVRQALTRRGWVAPAAAAGPQGGFISGNGGGNAFFCRAGASMHVSAAAGQGGEGYLRVTRSTDQRYSPCTGRADDMRWSPPLVLPTLRPPPGARVVPTGSGGSPDRMESSARIDTDLSVETLMTHYGEQLRDAGWSLVSAVTGESAAVSGWRLHDDEGDAWHGLLVSDIVPGSGRTELLLRAIRVDVGGP